MQETMSERAAGKRKLSDVDSENLVSEFKNQQLPPNDDDVEMADDDDDVELITDVVPGYNPNIDNDADNDALIQARFNPRGVTLLIRVCFNGIYATSPFPVPAHRAQKMWQILEIIHQHLPWLIFENKYDESLRYSAMQILTEPVFLLQETSYKIYNLRCSPWITTFFNQDGQAFFHWYRRNVQQGEETALKVEVRLRTDEKIENFPLLRLAGHGEAVLENKLYHKLDTFGNNDHSAIWAQLCNQGEPAFFTPLTEASTPVYFPERRHKRETIDQGAGAGPSEAMELDVGAFGSGEGPATAAAPQESWMQYEDLEKIDWKAWRVKWEADYAA